MLISFDVVCLVLFVAYCLRWFMLVCCLLWFAICRFEFCCTCWLLMFFIGWFGWIGLLVELCGFRWVVVFVFVGFVFLIWCLA